MYKKVGFFAYKEMDKEIKSILVLLAKKKRISTVLLVL